ncbi:hypothetical protein QWY31_15695 [Cytophagales bacterium LB-30]|uniref:Mechanosensitive ion channel family protein n=1 Tax=Shiella aurantiaca TaxID=3058365 RepID=A0ABT8F9B4_9BACT|nr:hypothetical protein [Shiella aurantiaca]MDN4166954.1 hypothetical protein [Shiella aurantiaca]
MRLLYFLLGLSLLSQSAFAQEDSLRTLLRERDSLVVKYYDLQKQNSSFWGTKSKADLRAIIETLKGIIQKDNQVVQVIKIQHAQKANALNSKNMAGTHRLYELENALSSAQSLNAVKERKIRLLEEEVEMLKPYRFKFHGAVSIILLIAAWGGYRTYRKIISKK